MTGFNHIPTSDETIEKIHTDLPSFIGGKRLSHTLSVQKEATKLCEIFFPYLDIDKKYKNDIIASALLHDITKYQNFDEHLEILKKHGVSDNSIDLSEGVLHAFSGAYKARDLFCINDVVFSAIYYHTTGKENMNIFEKIIFIADYIEEERTHPQCKEAREYFYSNIDKTDNKMEILDKTIIMSLKNTLSFLESKGLSINPMTNKAYLFLLAEYALQ